MKWKALLLGLILWPTIALSDSGSGLLLRGVSKATAAPTNFTVTSYYTGGTVQYVFDYTDATKVLNSGGTSATNGEKVDQVNQQTGGSALTLKQTTDANRPTNTTGITNGKQGGVYTGSPMFMTLTGTGNTAVIKNTQLVSFGTAFRFDSAAANVSFFRMYDSSFSHNRFRAFLASNQPGLDSQKADSTASTTVTATQTLATATVHVLLYEIDLTAGTCTIYLNNAVTSVNAAACAGGAGTFANTNGQEPRVNATSNVAQFYTHLVTGALMDSTQRAAYFADVKSQLGITVY